MPTDMERLDFLETLRNRAVFVNKKNPAYYQPADIHIHGPDRCSLYARSLCSDIVFQGHGLSVRGAIDAAMSDAAARERGLGVGPGRGIEERTVVQGETLMADENNPAVTDRPSDGIIRLRDAIQELDTQADTIENRAARFALSADPDDWWKADALRIRAHGVRTAINVLMNMKPDAEAISIHYTTATSGDKALMD